jgi:hypothetical protein
MASCKLYVSPVIFPQASNWEASRGCSKQATAIPNQMEVINAFLD